MFLVTFALKGILFCTCGIAPSVATASIFSDKISFTAFLAASGDKPLSKAEKLFCIKSVKSLAKLFIFYNVFVY